MKCEHSAFGDQTLLVNAAEGDRQSSHYGQSSHWIIKSPENFLSAKVIFAIKNQLTMFTDPVCGDLVFEGQFIMDWFPI